MLDGERPFASYKSVQLVRDHTWRVYGTRARRYCAHASVYGLHRAASEEGKEKTLKKGLSNYIFYTNYLTNLTCLRFNSTLTRLSNTNVYPVTLVRPM